MDVVTVGATVRLWHRIGFVVLVVAAVEYILVQLLVAAAWSDPPYDWNTNLISDLGNTTCGPFTQGDVTTQVCSPLHAVMNIGFITDGALTAAGALLLARWWPRRPSAAVGTVLLAVAGAQRTLVGVFPENTVAGLHTVGALNLITAAVAISLLSISVLDRHRVAGWCGLCLVAISAAAIAGFVLLVQAGNPQLLGLGPGAVERLIAYPVNLWPVVFVLALAIGTR